VSLAKKCRRKKRKKSDVRDHLKSFGDKTVWKGGEGKKKKYGRQRKKPAGKGSPILDQAVKSQGGETLRTVKENVNVSATKGGLVVGERKESIKKKNKRGLARGNPRLELPLLLNQPEGKTKSRDGG